MRTTVYIVGDPSHTRHIAELLAMEADEVEVVAVGTTYQPVVVSERLDLTFSVNCNCLNDIKSMYSQNEDVRDDTDAVLAGIQELRDWMENKIRAVVKTMARSRRQHRLPIFQPCWSARRWRSVT